MAQEIVGSRFKAENVFGQNGYRGPSSTVPGETEPHYGIQASKPTAPSNVQVRSVSAEPYPLAHGMRHRNLDPARVPSGNNRAVSQMAPRGSRKR